MRCRARHAIIFCLLSRPSTIATALRCCRSRSRSRSSSPADSERCELMACATHSKTSIGRRSDQACARIRPTVRTVAAINRSQLSRRPRLVTSCAKQQEGAPQEVDRAAPSALQNLRSLVNTQAYSVWLQGAVVLFLLGLLDAAYSGDWSRIGVISKENELQLQQAVVAIGCFHLICGPTAALLAWIKGKPVLPAFAKVMLVGGLALLEVALQESRKPQHTAM